MQAQIRGILLFDVVGSTRFGHRDFMQVSKGLCSLRTLSFVTIKSNYHGNGRGVRNQQGRTKTKAREMIIPDLNIDLLSQINSRGDS
jgi:hypothetical protein